jgi:hypothetical protein
MGGGGGTMPPMMGMMMLMMIIRQLIGDPNSWRMGGMMGGGMMGGGMGGMGGGMMGGMGGMGGGMMGGGMMSVPPTGQPYSPIDPGQTNLLNTRSVSLVGPDSDGKTVMPLEGQSLKLVDISETSYGARAQAAFRRLAEDKAPTVVTQLVMWNVTQDLDWNTIATLSKEWANAHEIAMARDFVARLDQTKGALPRDEKLNIPDETGYLYFDVKTDSPSLQTFAKELTETLDGKLIFGLKSKIGSPDRPSGPSVVARVRLSEKNGKAEASIQAACSDAGFKNWTPVGKFNLSLVRDEKGQVKMFDATKGIGEGLLGRLVRAQVTKGKRHVKGKMIYFIRVENVSPLALNGIAISGVTDEASKTPSVVSGLTLAPHRGLSLPATAEVVEKMGLKDGIRVLAVDLSGL